MARESRDKPQAKYLLCLPNKLDLTFYFAGSVLVLDVSTAA